MNTIRSLHALTRSPSICLLVLFSAVASGCSNQEEIDDTYGRVQSYFGGHGVNGTAALVKMFEQVGCKVKRWSRMSPKLRRADVIVWFPDSFEPPSVQQRDFLEDWLSRESGRSLIYVGRDYNAEITYWDSVIGGASSNDVQEFQLRRGNAQSQHDLERSSMPAEAFAGWFVVRRDGEFREIDSVQGPWRTGFDASRADIQLHGSLDIPDSADLPPGTLEDALPQCEMLLTSTGDPLITRVTRDDWEESQIIVVANGSFLLNLPLVNHEHRKLAHRLVEEVAVDDRQNEPTKVSFLESQGNGPKVFLEEPRPAWSSGFEVFASWPLGIILLHLFALGFIFCMSRFPIFGKPRGRPSDAVSDFGKHITALGKHLQQSGDTAYARQRIDQYQRAVRRQEPGTREKGS